MAKGSFTDLIGSDTATLIDFSAAWCGPCQMMPPILEKLKGMVGNQVRIIKIDIDHNPAVAATYQVQSVPTLALFRSGKLLWRQSGVIPAEQIKQAIDRHK
jgi:thioredoxin 1